jgi:multiple sugar transport system permease protein
MPGQRETATAHIGFESGKRARLTLAQRRSLVGLLFVLPGIVPLLIFVVYPMVSALYLSFTNWQLIGAAQLQGFQNYTQLSSNDQFRSALTVTLEFAIGTAIPSCILALVIALLLDVRVRFTGWYQPLFFLPAVLPTVVTSIVWGILYQGNGVINNALGLSIGWLTDPSWALPALILMLIWTNLGYYSVILLAGVREIPHDYYEAARIDGAGTLDLIMHITLPLIKPALLFVVVIATSNALTLFVQPYLLTAGGPGDATRTLSELIYDMAFSFLNIGEATAMSFVLLLISLLVAFIQFTLLRAKDV